MFFYNSTTLFLFPRTATPMVGPNRNVNVILGVIKRGLGLAWSGTKLAARIIAKPFQLAAGTKIAAGAVGLGARGIKAGFNVVETVEHTAIETTRGLVNATLVPMGIWALSPLHSLWVKIRYLTMDVLKAAVKTPIAIAKSPLELVRGVRDSIVSIPRNLYDLGKNIFGLRVRDAIGSTRKLITDALLPPITRPLGPVFAPIKTAVSTEIRSELVPLLAVKKGFEHSVGGFKQMYNAYPTAKGIVARKNAERDMLALKRKKEKEAEEEDAEKKAKEVSKEKDKMKGSKKEGKKAA